MDALLMVLIDAIKTVDGNRNSLPIIEKFVLNQKAKINRQRKKNETLVLTEQEKTSIF